MDERMIEEHLLDRGRDGVSIRFAAKWRAGPNKAGMSESTSGDIERSWRNIRFRRFRKFGRDWLFSADRARRWAWTSSAAGHGRENRLALGYQIKFIVQEIYQNRFLLRHSNMLHVAFGRFCG
jgi:hypothetical protein